MIKPSLLNEMAAAPDRSDILHRLNPQSNLERWLATDIAEDLWCLFRARAIEFNIFCIGLSGSLGESSIANRPETRAALALYEQRVRRNLEKNEKHLAQLQAERKADRHDASKRNFPNER